MAADGAQSEQQWYGDASTTELIDRLSRFQGAPGEFLGNLLAVQCRLASAIAGAILRPGADGRTEVAAVFPPPEEGSAVPVWLASAVESAGQAVSAGATTVKSLHGPDDLYGQPAGRHLVMIPLKGDQGIRGLGAFVIETSDDAVIAASRERLELTISLLSLYEIRLTLQRRQADLSRLRKAMEVLSAVNEQDRFTGAAMAFCNETASRWQCERVSLGFLKGRYVRLKAMSHTEKFSRKMKIVQDIESAMEECLDQDVEVVYPPEAEATCVSRSAGELSKRHGPTAVVGFPLRRSGEPVAVLTVERPADRPMALNEIEPLRLTCELCTARLANLHENDRWFGAKVMADARKAMATLVGPKHTWMKAAAILIFAAVVFLIFAKGDYRADATFVFEATQRQVVPVPFDGFLKSVSVVPGDSVTAGESILAGLDTSDLRLQLAGARAERLAYQKRADAAMRDEKTAEAQVAHAEADKVNAHIHLLEHHIRKAQIVSPISGCVVTGDLKRQIGAPVKTGDVLFEVAPLGSLRAELFVPEDEIADVVRMVEAAEKRGDVVRGELAAAGKPDRHIPFVVERINPVAEVIDQRNVFRVRVRLLETHSGMRPGMEGVAKIHLGRRRYAWLWTRKLVNWLRMKLWL